MLRGKIRGFTTSPASWIMSVVWPVLFGKKSCFDIFFFSLSKSTIRSFADIWRLMSLLYSKTECIQHWIMWWAEVRAAWEFIYLSVSLPHFILCFSIAAGRHLASHITIFPSMDRPSRSRLMQKMEFRIPACAVEIGHHRQTHNMCRKPRNTYCNDWKTDFDWGGIWFLMSFFLQRADRKSVVSAPWVLVSDRRVCCCTRSERMLYS